MEETTQEPVATEGAPVESADAGNSTEQQVVTPGPWDSLPGDLREHDAIKGLSLEDAVKKLVSMSDTGVPEDPGGYEIKVPEGQQVDEKFMGLAKEWAHKSGIGKEQFAQLASHWMDFERTMMEAQKQEFDAEWDSYRLECGGNDRLEARIARARQAALKFVGEDFAKLLASRAFSAQMTKAFVQIGEAIGDDYLELGKATPSGPQVKRDMYGRAMLSFG